MKTCLFDIETTGLLNESSIDYTALPYKLKPNFKIHCGVVIDVDTGEKCLYTPENIHTLVYKLKSYDVIVGHNIVNFDLLVLKLKYCALFSIRDDVGEYDTFCGKPVLIQDTLVMSKLQYPDRKGHSLEWWGDSLGYAKIDWKAKARELELKDEWSEYHPEMLVYCERDAELNVKVYQKLLQERGNWNWDKAYTLELQVKELVTRGSHRGFVFNKALAEAYVRDLDEKLEERRAKIEPIIPPKPPTQAEEKGFIPPKVQLTKDGRISSLMKKWVDKHDGKYWEEDENLPARVAVFGKKYRLPIGCVSFLTEVPAKISHFSHIKEWLISLGWTPSEWAERDLSVNTHKQKLPIDKFEAAVERYTASTIGSKFMKFRMKHLELSISRDSEVNANKIRTKLLMAERPKKVITSPKFTVGVEKKICPSLLQLGDSFPYVKELVEYLTYRHRRNSLLGGGYNPDDDEENDYETGYLANIRTDGRITTDADTCGTSTSRFKHYVVANVPKVSALYGKEMRGLFGIGDDCFQIGYDFDSLEAKVEGHWCIAVAKATNGNVLQAETYSYMVSAEKPNDIHTLTAKNISEALNREFSRNSAKSLKYGCSYGAQIKRVMSIVGCSEAEAKLVFDSFWESAAPLADVKTYYENFYKTKGEKKWIIGIDNRKLFIRSKHSIVNMLFQSTGVICAKKAMVLHDRKLRDAGLLIDFFEENTAGKSWCQQLIAYHDEAQLEVDRKSVKFKRFTDKDEAETFKREHEGWSDVSEAQKGGGWFVGYCEAGKMALDSVAEASSYYNLEVPLTAGYIIGTNWGNCH